MSDKDRHYEEIRRHLKRERRSPNVYTKNRVEAMLEDARKMIDPKAEKEIKREFDLDRWHR